MRSTGRKEEVFCPRCGRYVGPFERCPYCGARVPKRLAFRLLKWGGLALGIFGVLFLYLDLYSFHLIIEEPPTIEIRDIPPTMNFAQVCVRGKVTFVKYYEDTGFLGMYISDNDGNSIFIRAYDTETRRLLEMERRRLAENDPEPKFPAVGDMIEVCGQLRIQGKAEANAGFQMMILQFVEGLTIKRPEATPVTIAQVVSNPENFDEYERLEIEGKIISSTDRGWATLLTLYEMESGTETTLLVPKNLTEFGRILETRIGDMVRVKGAFSLYYGEPQLWLASWDDLEVL